MDDPLLRYRGKRNFDRTPEPDAAPAGGHTGATEALGYVIQKHWASHLHYDFRLELDGTMKSWAVPKGPSLDPKVKRMAVEVEDHPVGYASFEGTIPAGQYGAGKVIVWDRGSWLPLGDARQGLREGNLKFELKGDKLRGKWVLVRMKPRSGAAAERQPAWLLIKEKDEHARAKAAYDVVEALPDRVAASPALEAEPALKPAPKAAGKLALPKWMPPQLATLVDAPPSDSAPWSAEIKLDGYRLMCRIDGRDIRLYTRNANDWTAKLKPLQRALAALKLPAGWYDGEMVVLNEAGLPDFGALQKAFDGSAAAAAVKLVLYLFDLPFCNGQDLRDEPLDARRSRLQALLADGPDERVRYSASFDGPLDAMLASACKLGLEGVIAKRRDAPYSAGRSASWIKLKCRQRQEFVVGGYTDPQGSRSGIGALLLGVYERAAAPGEGEGEGTSTGGSGAHSELLYAGRVGSGFNQRTLRELEAALKSRASPSSPFVRGGVIEGKPHWVKPGLVAEVSFGEWTGSGRVRQAVFQGLRKDKEAKGVVRERPLAVSKLAPDVDLPALPALPELPADLRVSHPERVIDAASGTTKLDLVRYYALVGRAMMEHLAGRPVALLRAPAGVGGELFFQKHAATEKMKGLRPLVGAGDPSDAPLLEVGSAIGLLSAAQWNVVEFHTANQSRPSLARPDRLVLDLDPGEGLAWSQVQEAAELVRGFLEQLELPCYLKTSGGKGLHLVVPLRRLHDWGTVKGFSQQVVNHLAATIPQRFVAKSGPKNRVGKVFVDYLRNGPGATTACAWSARARPGMGISVPVEWSELDSLTGGDHWTVATAASRIGRGNAPWQGYAEAARGLGAAIKRLQPKGG